MIITDGNGSGYQAKVSTDHRLATDSISFSRAEDAVELGDAYNINTGVISLTTANKSATLYVKNNEGSPLIISNIFYLIGNSTGGSGDMLITVRRNPTTGTLISNATAAEMAGVNRNFGSSKTLDANIYKGAEGSTVTDGDKVIESIFNQTPNRYILNVGSIDLPKGTSISFEITPATGNTSLDVQFALDCFLDTRFSK